MNSTRWREQKSERGQGTVEFILIAIMLAFVMVLGWQMAWAACQKWYFNATAAYAARAWSVQPQNLYRPSEILYKVQSLAFIRSPNLVKMPLVKIMTAEDENASAGEADEDDRFGTGSLPNGIRYEGLGFYLNVFKPSTIQSAGFAKTATRIDGSLRRPETGAIYFETYIPIDHEDTFGTEDPGRYDNDCSFPCNDNGR
jgi:hypothetical protein